MSDAGLLTVMDPDGRSVIAEYTPEQVFGAFGMSCPVALPDQRAEAWALIREQLDGLAELLTAAGLDRAETEYLHEDGNAGLQDVLLFGLDGAPAEPDPREFPLPALVSRSDLGRVRVIPLNGTGTLRDLADAVFESLSGFILDDPDAVIDRIRIRLSADGDLTVETDAFVNRTWTPPGADDPSGVDEETPGL